MVIVSHHSKLHSSVKPLNENFSEQWFGRSIFMRHGYIEHCVESKEVYKACVKSSPIQPQPDFTTISFNSFPASVGCTVLFIPCFKGLKNLCGIYHYICIHHATLNSHKGCHLYGLTSTMSESSKLQ